MYFCMHQVPTVHIYRSVSRGGYIRADVLAGWLDKVRVASLLLLEEAFVSIRMKLAKLPDQNPKGVVMAAAPLEQKP